MYIPLHNEEKTEYFFKISFKVLYGIAASLPLLGLFVCVIITILKDFESANWTHCEVNNFFPSLSAAIGNYEPQRHVWLTAIFVHAPARFITVYLRMKYFERVIVSKMLPFVYIAILLNILENMSLIALSYWTSKMYYPYHEKSFKTFIGTSLIYMFIICVLLTKYKKKPFIHSSKQKSLKLKWRLFIANTVSIAFAAYFFARHNAYCEPYVYSMFGFSEYVFVITNILFHMTTIYDFSLQDVLFTSDGLVTR